MKCIHCHRKAVLLRGQTIYCGIHARIKQMRYDAKQKRKSVPTMDELLSLAMAVTQRAMRCECCDRTMNWLLREGHSTVVTLQHDRSGRFRLICFACNTRHSKHPGDSFYEIPKGSKKCFGCGAVKPHSEFHRNRASRDGMQTRCRECQKVADIKRHHKRRELAKCES